MRSRPARLLLAPIALLAVALASCSDDPEEVETGSGGTGGTSTSVSVDPDDPVAMLEASRAQWVEAGIDDYQLEYRTGGGERLSFHMLITVEGGEVTGAEALDDLGLDPEVFDNPEARMDVEAMFDLVSEATAEAFSVEVDYDDTLGFPTDVFIDWEQNTIDEEFGWTVLSFAETGTTTTTSAPDSSTTVPRDTTVPTTKPPDGEAGLAREWEAARARWDAAGIDDYTIAYRQLCFCPHVAVRVEVVDGEVVNVVSLDPEPPMSLEPEDQLTVDDLFDEAREAFGADRVAITYDDELGYPITIDVDQILEAVDDEYTWTVESFTPS
jgi:hypothetical protein